MSTTKNDLMAEAVEIASQDLLETAREKSKSGAFEFKSVPKNSQPLSKEVIEKHRQSTLENMEVVVGKALLQERQEQKKSNP